MNANVISDKCHEIYSSLSGDAIHACTLFIEYDRARKSLRDSSIDGQNLQKFCYEHKAIRSEIKVARDKVRAIIKEDDNSPDCLSLPTKRKIKKLEHEIEQAKKKECVSPRQKIYNIISIVLFIVGMALLAVAVINFLIGAVHIVLEGGTGESHESYVHRFWKYLLLAGIDATVWFILPKSSNMIKNKKSELNALYSQLNSDESFDKSRRLRALMDEQRYSIILDLIDGTPIMNIVFEEE